MIRSKDAPPDTRSMAIIHDALSRDFARTHTALASAPYPDPTRRAAIADHVAWTPSIRFGQS